MPASLMAASFASTLQASPLVDSVGRDFGVQMYADAPDTTTPKTQVEDKTKLEDSIKKVI